jgi:hypothetical protein
MTCANCGAEIAEPPFKTGIWVEVMGDEYGFGYVACEACGYFTESSSRDSITAGDFEYAPRSFSKERGEQIVRLIGACPDRSDKRCECPVHEKFRRSPPPSRAGVAW